MSGPDWQSIVEGDREAFDALVESEMSGLLEAAKHEIAYYEDVGDFPPRYMTPEELVGEAMIQAWDHRAKKPKGMSPRAWLYAMLFQAADKLAARRREIQAHEALSTDQEIPDDPLVLDPEPRRLKPEERRAALLYFRLGFSMEEVCRVLGKPADEAGRLLEKARDAVRG